jgi:dipeptide transport system ATP-binding protein
VPGAYDRPQGCLFGPRCRFVDARKRVQRPTLEDDPVGGLPGQVRCFTPLGRDGVPEGGGAW